MTNELEPIVGCWYHHLDKGQLFNVIAVDDDIGWVEIQYFDGGLEEFDRDEWDQLNIELSEEPEDFSGAMDIAEIDDLGGTNVTDTEPEDWSEPLREEIVKQRSEDTRNAEVAADDADRDQA